MFPAPPPTVFTDLHSHLVPAVDDGVTSVAEALETLAALRADGVDALVTTPHLLVPWLETAAELRRTLDGQRRAYEEVVAACAGRTDLPVMALGQEVLAPTSAEARRALTVPGVGLSETPFVLVEFGFTLQGRHLDVIEAVQEAGREIVIAHAERYLFDSIEEGVDLIREWHGGGAWLQINAGSIGGYYATSNPLSEEVAWAAIREGLAHLIATDHHGIGRRKGVSLQEASDLLVARGGAQQAEQLLRGNPERIRRSELPQEVPPLDCGSED